MHERKTRSHERHPDIDTQGHVKASPPERRPKREGSVDVHARHDAVVVEAASFRPQKAAPKTSTKRESSDTTVDSRAALEREFGPHQTDPFADAFLAGQERQAAHS
tara:strand:+ start:825 stop:1142 length:318 start_codon:yes stop_codon:yes gene_type:complete